MTSVKDRRAENGKSDTIVGHNINMWNMSMEGIANALKLFSWHHVKNGVIEERISGK